MLKVYNTLTRRKEVFRPRKNKTVDMFVCGQTVYDDAHLGHAKAYINFDIIVRWLRHVGFKVKYVQNITDVDDKIIRRAKERGVEPLKLAEYYTKRFFEDMEAIGVKQNVDLFPKSSDYIPQIIEQIKTLIKKGYAYVVDGNVYYHVPKFKDYTKLSRISLEELKKHRIEPDPRKRSPLDFALWKAQKPGEIAWDSPWGKGRPGWHIEDTAMIFTIFGPQYDLHGGASELIFPHHTNEIAQAEAASGKKPFVKYWLHCGVLNVKGVKMSKSLRNFITIRNTLKRHGAEALRLYYASTHYRKPIDFDERNLEMAERKLEMLYNTIENLRYAVSDKKFDENEEEFLKFTEEVKAKFADAMNDDFNTPLALSYLFNFSREINKFIKKRKVSKKFAEKIEREFRGLGYIIGILQKEVRTEELPERIKRMIEERERARKREDWKTADRIRDEIKKLGYILEDTPEGVRWKRVKAIKKASYC